MTLQKNPMQYQATPIKDPQRRQDLRIISEMTTFRVVMFLTHRHRVGLLALANISLVAYVVWDKVAHFL